VYACRPILVRFSFAMCANLREDWRLLPRVRCSLDKRSSIFAVLHNYSGHAAQPTDDASEAVDSTAAGLRPLVDERLALQTKRRSYHIRIPRPARRCSQASSPKSSSYNAVPTGRGQISSSSAAAISWRIARRVCNELDARLLLLLLILQPLPDAVCRCRD